MFIRIASQTGLKCYLFSCWLITKSFKQIWSPGFFCQNEITCVLIQSKSFPLSDWWLPFESSFILPQTDQGLLLLFNCSCRVTIVKTHTILLSSANSEKVPEIPFSGLFPYVGGTNALWIFKCIAECLGLFQLLFLLGQNLSLPISCLSLAGRERLGYGVGGKMGWDPNPILKWMRAGYSQNSSKITHIKKSHLVNITFCFCLRCSFYTTWQFMVLCHISELRFTNIWLWATFHPPWPPLPLG